MRRRAVVLGAGASALLPRRSWGTGPDATWSALDAAATLPPADALARLAPIDVTHLSPARRLDVLTARAGLALDAHLLRAPDDYAARIERTLGDGVRVEDARDRLHRALASLHAEADRAFTSIGLTTGSIGERYRTLFADERFLPEDSDAGRAMALAEMRAMLAPLRTVTRRLFPDAPAWALACDVRALDAQEIAAGKGGYRVVPTPIRSGCYIVDLKDVRRRALWTLPSVVAHELLPGHMLQLGIEALTPPHPLRERYASAFVEGWGISAEAMAGEAGLFATPRDRLGHLHWLIFRIGRGLADVGIHADSWSIAKASVQLTDWQGAPVYFAPFDEDLARIAREPGVRAAEALAWLALAERRPHGLVARRRWLAATLRDGRKRAEQLPG